MAIESRYSETYERRKEGIENNQWAIQKVKALITFESPGKRNMVYPVEQWQLSFFEIWSKSSPADTSENVMCHKV